MKNRTGILASVVTIQSILAYYYYNVFWSIFQYNRYIIHGIATLLVHFWHMLTHKSPFVPKYTNSTLAGAVLFIPFIPFTRNSRHARNNAVRNYSF